MEEYEEILLNEYRVVNKSFDYDDNFDYSYEIFWARDKEGELKYIKCFDLNIGNDALDYVRRHYQSVPEIKHSCMSNKVEKVFNDQNWLYIVLEVGVGECMSSLMKKEKSINVERVIKWATQLCDFIEYLHQLETERFLYACISPSYIFVSEDDRIKLLDDSFIRSKADKKIGARAIELDMCVLFAPGFNAPETFATSTSYTGEGLDVRTDLYGLGALMYYCVTGMNPYDPPYEIRHICEINPTLSKGMDYIIDKCTKRDPAERYQSVDELLNDLARYQELPRKKDLLQYFQKGLKKVIR